MHFWVLGLHQIEKALWMGEVFFQEKSHWVWRRCEFQGMFCGKSFYTGCWCRSLLCLFQRQNLFHWDFNHSCSAYKWLVNNWDSIEAYLNSPINEDVWLITLEGMQAPPGHSLKLQKVLYGIQEAAAYERGPVWMRVQSFSTLKQSLCFETGESEWGSVATHGLQSCHSAMCVILCQLKKDLKHLLKIKLEHKLTSILGLGI